MAEELPTDLVKAKVVARDLHCHVSTIFRWIHEGKLRAWKCGCRYLVSRSEARELMALVTPTVNEPAKDGLRTRAEELREEVAARDRLRACGARV